jgi:cullin 1
MKQLMFSKAFLTKLLSFIFLHSIMKARKTIKNQALIQEVISQISQRFAPKIPDIKKAIETLLEKEYMERVEGSKDTFAYIA